MIAIESPEYDQLSQLRDIKWSGESQLPIPPQAVVDFSARARKPDVTVRELSAVIECEPTLTAELLRNVNSCMFGLRRKIDSVTQAIALLGIPHSTTILLTSALSNAVEQIDSPIIPAADFRRETVERAIFARETARLLRLDPTISYTGAMLQDLMLPLLTRRHQVDYHEYLHQSTWNSLCEFEMERFGWTHAQIAAKTLLKWGFSEALVLAVLRHHEPPESILVGEETLPATFACCTAAMLPDLMNQSPDGVKRLVDLQRIEPRFQAIAIATTVDEAAQELSSHLQHPLSLVHRFQNAMLSQLDQRRKQAITPGRQFGNYVLEEKIKESSMGAIYKAVHLRMRRPAAVKILRSDRATNSAIAQFEQEVRLTSTLRHPNTIAIFDYGHTPDDLFYYAMELIEGLTLAELVRITGRLPDGRVLALMHQICGALADAHESHLIHRDIKPENIMVSHRARRPDHITVVDFGLVTNCRTEAPAPDQAVRSVVGTPLYMSPEAARGRDVVCARSDLYSLAAVGYFLLTGTPVFNGRTVPDVLDQHKRSTPVPPSERCDAQISPEFEAAIMQCLQKDPANRPESALVLMDTLSRCVPREPWSTADATRWWNDFLQNRASAPVNELLTDTCGSTLVTTDIGSLACSDSFLSE